MNPAAHADLGGFVESVRAMLKSQYHAALAMLRESIERCPEDLWYSDEPTNAFWQVAYHTLFITHLYLQPEEAAFRPWDGHRADAQYPDGIPGPAEPTSALPLLPEPYSRREVLAYWVACDDMVDAAVDAVDLLSRESGFHWYAVPKLEHQLVNLRHVQHHTAQLADRLRAATDIGVRWVGTKGAT